MGLNDNGEVYIVPMNFGYTFEDGQIAFYLHGAKEGRKYDILRNNPKIGFEMDCDVEPFYGQTACQYGTEYKSIIGKGSVEFIEEPLEKIKAMEILMKTQTGKDFTFDEKMVASVTVLKIWVHSFTGKCRPKPPTEFLVNKNTK